MLLALFLRTQSFSPPRTFLLGRHVVAWAMSHSTTTQPQPSQQQQYRAKRVTAQDLIQCGQRLRQGDLVAFPTETVYGLGCHALDEEACRKVFQAKERPLTDPLIVHVNEAQHAYPLWKATANNNNNNNNNNDDASLQARILTTLCDAFWPGPLTLVAVASDAVPSVVMAGTGFVAARSPRHDLARALIDAAAVPLAAPSANKFGHVSPTTAQHVWDDLCHEDVWILEQSAVTDNDDDEQQSSLSSSQVGVESSVVKLQMSDDHEESSATLTVLRQGAVSVQDIEQALRKVNLHDVVSVIAKSNQQVTEATATVSPGQNIRHYSPNVPSFLLSTQCVDTLVKLSSSSSSSITNLLQGTVILDFAGQCTNLRDNVLAYRDLSPSGDSAQAAQWVYKSLRWAEQVPHAHYILFAPLDTTKYNHTSTSNALLLAVQDRLIRAASGVVLDSLDTLVAANGQN